MFLSQNSQFLSETINYQHNSQTKNTTFPSNTTQQGSFYSGGAQSSSTCDQSSTAFDSDTQNHGTNGSQHRFSNNAPRYKRRQQSLHGFFLNELKELKKLLQTANQQSKSDIKQEILETTQIISDIENNRQDDHLHYISIVSKSN